MADRSTSKCRFKRETRRTLESILERSAKNAADDATMSNLLQGLEQLVGRYLHPGPEDAPYGIPPKSPELAADVRKIVAALNALVSVVDNVLPETRARLNHDGSGTIGVAFGLPPHPNPWHVLSALHDDARDIIPAVQRILPTYAKRGRGALPHQSHHLATDVAFLFTLHGRRVSTSLGGVFGRVLAELFSLVYGADAPRNPFPMIKTGSDYVKGMSQIEATRIDTRVRERMTAFSAGNPTTR